MLAGSVDALIWAPAAVLVAVTALPLSASKAWWVRMWDFLRAQIAAGLAVVLVAGLVVRPAWGWALLAAGAAALAYQLWRIRPYTPLFRKEVGFAAPDPGRDVVCLALNVLMENETHRAVADLITRVDPDVLLLMETDPVWLAALEPVFARYPTVIRVPRDDHYGLAFATRLETVAARALRLTADETPSVFAELKARDGTAFRFVGLHPKPPVPGEDTDERDAQILYAARFAARSGVPLVSMGDFNDTAWSDTAQRFKHVGGYLDPRIGRGLHSSFDAKRWWFRCPIDQIYVTPDVAMVSFRRGPRVGSDHFPMIAVLRPDPETAGRLNQAPVPLAGAEAAAVEAGVAAWRSRLGDAAFPPPE